MPVFNVECTYKPNGVKRSRPIVAMDADEARGIAELEWDAEGDEFTWNITGRPDPDGSFEHALADAERRRLESEYHQWRK